MRKRHIYVIGKGCLQLSYESASKASSIVNARHVKIMCSIGDANHAII